MGNEREKIMVATTNETQDQTTREEKEEKRAACHPHATITCMVDLKTEELCDRVSVGMRSHDERGLAYSWGWGGTIDEADGENVTESVKEAMGIFRAALEQFGLGAYIDEWDGETRYKRHYHESILDENGNVLAECDSWSVDKLPRKRRYRKITAEFNFDLDTLPPCEPYAAFNPAGRDIEFRSAGYVDLARLDSLDCDCFEFKYESQCIAEGLAAAKATLEYYEMVARIFEEKTGRKPTLDGCDD